MTDKKPFHGVYVAMATPMHEDESIDWGRLEQFADHLIGQGVHGLVALGSTGEFYAQTPEERKAVLRAVIKATAGRVPVLAGVNACSTREVVDYARDAQQAGADGLLLAPPYYSLPTLDELYDHLRAVNDAISFPIMLYNYPGRTGVDMVPEFVQRLTALSRVRYIKESTGDITRMHDIIRRCGRQITVFCGGDTVALESFVLGVTGWVAGIGNVLPRCHVRLYDLAVVKKDFLAARDFYYQILPALDHIENSKQYTQFVKAGCAIMGWPVGPVRRPLAALPPEKYQRLQAVLEPLRGFEASGR